jgi:hypothetical protein
MADHGAIIDPYLFIFVLLGGGLLCLIAVVVTNNKVITDYDAGKTYTEKPLTFPPPR